MNGKQARKIRKVAAQYADRKRQAEYATTAGSERVKTAYSPQYAMAMGINNPSVRTCSLHRNDAYFNVNKS